MSNTLKIVGAFVITGIVSILGGLFLLGTAVTALGPSPQPTHSVVVEHKSPTHKATHKPAPKHTAKKASPTHKTTHKPAPKHTAKKASPAPKHTAKKPEAKPTHKATTKAPAPTKDEQFKALLLSNGWFKGQTLDANTYKAAHSVCSLRQGGMTNSEIDAQVADQGVNPVATEVFVEDAETVYCPDLYTDQGN